MVEVLTVLRDYPIPTLMIVGGIVLLVLSVATNIGDKVQVSKERQKWSWIAGILLIFLGSMFYFIQPAPESENELPTAVPTSRPTATADEIVAATVAPTLLAATQTEEPLPPTDTPITPTNTVLIPTDSGTVSLVCQNQPRYFQEYWSIRLTVLGCPLSAGPAGLKLVRQSFENGWMFSREDTGVIWVLFDNHTYQTFQDTWQAGDNEYSCSNLAISQTPPTPRRGFGAVWCSSEEVRNVLGIATDSEESSTVNYQTFEHGIIFEYKKEIFLLVEDDQVWTQLK